jgi:hypothetical protein
MGRNLNWLGSMLLLLTVLFWIADAADLIPGSTDDQWSGLTLRAGVIALALALLLRLFAPVANRIRSGRCTVCGHPTARGHMYCLDHLQETVNAGRDQARGRTIASPKART